MRFLWRSSRNDNNLISCRNGIESSPDSFCGDEQDTSFFVSYVSFPILAMLTSMLRFFTSLLTQGVFLAIFISWLYQIKNTAK